MAVVSVMQLIFLTLYNQAILSQKGSILSWFRQTFQANFREGLHKEPQVFHR